MKAVPCDYALSLSLQQSPKPQRRTHENHNVLLVYRWHGLCHVNLPHADLHWVKDWRIIMKWSNAKITIYVWSDDGKNSVRKDITAKCKGIFAIHDNYENPELKTLTHIPSGMSLIKESTIGLLYRATKQFEILDWDGVEAEQKPPKTFNLERFRQIQSSFSL